MTGVISKKERRKKGVLKLYAEEEKECIQRTNDSIVSKYSAERIYAPDGYSSYFTPFVGADRVRRRSPTLTGVTGCGCNALSMLSDASYQNAHPEKVVVNLGCFQDNVIYVDTDFPALISTKAQKVATDKLTPLLHNIQRETGPADQPRSKFEVMNISLLAVISSKSIGSTRCSRRRAS
ncbi:hypothetical protein EV426DRAFT_704816 [Tirmania nivea]|nr:hypothetical protein EV426DRAFT_704816 [Tirmania nivea]